MNDNPKRRMTHDQFRELVQLIAKDFDISVVAIALLGRQRLEKADAIECSIATGGFTQAGYREFVPQLLRRMATLTETIKPNTDEVPIVHWDHGKEN